MILSQAPLSAKEVRAYVQAETEVLTPVAQATVDAYADIVGGTIDAGVKQSVSITILNSHAVKDLDWKVLASIDGVTYVEVQAEATIQQLASSSYSVTPAPYRYYKVQVKSTVGANPAEATVRVIAK